MLKHYLFSLVTLFVVTVHAQVQTTMFEKIWGDEKGEALTFADELPNGDIIAFGAKKNEWTIFQLCAIRLTKTGNVLWEKMYGNPYNVCQYPHIYKSSSGTYLVAGAYVDPPTGNYSNGYLLEIDENGDTLMEKQYHDGFESSFHGVLTTSDGNLVMSCKLGWQNASAPVLGLFKTDRNGNEIWRKKFPTYSNYFLGQIRENADGSIIGIGGKTANEPFYVKFSAAGNLIWIKHPLATTPEIVGTPTSLKVFPNGDFEILYQTTNTSTTPYQFNIYLEKYDSSGQRIGRTDFQYPNGRIIVMPQFVDGDSKIRARSIGNSHLYETVADSSFKDIVGLQDHDTLTKFLLYYINANDGGFIGVGASVKDQNSLSRFFLVKFAPDGRYAVNDFAESLSLLPNPSRDGRFSLSFENKEAGTVLIEVFALDGRSIYRKDITCAPDSKITEAIHLDQSSIKAGIYILNITSGSERLQKMLVLTTE